MKCAGISDGLANAGLRPAPRAICETKTQTLIERLPLVFSISQIALPRGARLASPSFSPVLPFSCLLLRQECSVTADILD